MGQRTFCVPECCICWKIFSLAMWGAMSVNFSVSMMTCHAELSLWVPLHAVAAILSCYHAFRVSRWSRGTAYGLLVGSAAVILKEVSGYVVKGQFDWHSFTSLDMHKHDVQEKLGSALVLLAIALQLDALGVLFQSKSKSATITYTFPFLPIIITPSHVASKHGTDLEIA